MKVDRTSLKRPKLKNLLIKDLKIGTKALIYIYLFKDEDQDNPLRDLPYDERETEARYRAFGSHTFSFNKELGKEWSTLISESVASYKLTEEEKDIYTYNKKIDELNVLLKTTEPKIYRNKNINTDIVSFATNISILNMILKDIINIIQAKASLVAMYTRGVVPKHLRGGLSPLAKQELKL